MIQQQKRVIKSFAISETQNMMLQKLSRISMKSEADLIREAIELLFSTPGGKK